MTNLPYDAITTLDGLTAINLKPGDNVLITLRYGLDLRERDEMAERLREVFPGVRFALVPDVSFISVDMEGRTA